ncbi:hypothetical protein ABMA28_004954 [Loxostege sticticalis]|uniref:MADF domain-containing protein n=1 Tax=Loxostege sticticalis TaxID=481309 RepID=A0ABD0SNU1_LOXSC
MRWGEVETLKFVKLYLRHDNLWNPSDTDYRMKNKRQKAYNDIISEFRRSTGISMSELDLKIKIKNLRSTYTQEMSKIRQRSSPDFVYTPTIKWFADWHSCFSSIKKMDSLDDEANDDKKKDSGIHNEKQSNKYTTESDESYVILLKPEPEERTDDEFALDMHQRIKRRRKSFPQPIRYQFQSPSNSESTQPNLNTNQAEDEFDIYGKYLASQLRSMDLQKALRVQLEIQSIVSEARITSLSET